MTKLEKEYWKSVDRNLVNAMMRLSLLKRPRNEVVTYLSDGVRRVTLADVVFDGLSILRKKMSLRQWNAMKDNDDYTQFPRWGD